MLAVSALALGIRLWAASRVPIGYDGYWHVFIARNLLREYQHPPHPPLFLFLLGICDLAGHLPLAYRAIPMASGTAVVFLIGRILKRLGASTTVCGLGALAAAVSGNLIRLSLLVESNMLCAVLLLSSFPAYLNLIDPDPAAASHRNRVAFAGLASLALLSHYAAALWLAAALAAPILAAAAMPAYARALRAVFPRRWKADLATLAVPAGTALLLYLLLARRWVGTRALNHLPEFLLQAGAETVPAFLARTLASTFALLSPLPVESRGVSVALLLGYVVLVFVLAATDRRSRAFQPARVMPSGHLVALLAVGIVSGLAGIYPFGGSMRHQFLLYLFAPLAGWVAADRCARGGRSRAAGAALAAAGLLAVAAVGARTARGLATKRAEPFLPQVTAFERELGSEGTVQVDQFSLIGYFMHHHDGRWRYQGSTPREPSVEVYRMERAGRVRTVLAHRGTWSMNLEAPTVYDRLAAASATTGKGCSAVFFLQPRRPSSRDGSGRPTVSAGRLRELAARAGLEARRIRLDERSLTAVLCRAGDGRAGAPPRVRRIVPAGARAGVKFLQQPSGASALSVLGEGFGAGAVVFLGERPLTTTNGNPGWLTASVPDELYGRAGRLELKVVNPDRRESNVIVFEVLP